jgi:regulator of sirC expression with transglutaminase-like and TPR domain
MSDAGTNWEQFMAIAESPDEEIDLARAAFLIAAAEYPELDIHRELNVLDSLAGGASHRMGATREAIHSVNILSEYLFDEVGFSGNSEDYYDPRNSYLNEVLSRRLGIPITLSLVCLEVGKRLGVPLVGVGMPGHFLLRHRDEEDLFIDPFHRGILLSAEECAERLREIHQDNIAWDASLLEPVNNRDYVARMLRNLKAIYLQRQDLDRAIKMIDRLVAIVPQLPQERRDRGLVNYRLGRHQESRDDLQSYLQSATGDPDTEELQRLISRLESILRGETPGPNNY